MNVLETAKHLLIEKTIFDYLLYPPEGEALKIANRIMKLKNKPNMVYRGVSNAEYKNLKRDRRVVSKGVGNTRKGMTGSYVASDIQLAGRFALRSWMDGHGGYILTIDKRKLPDLTQADPGNFYTSFIPLTAVVDEFKL